MNDRYFACTDCKTYLDSGYRWCYWKLEEAGVVSLGQAVDVDRVLQHEPYWNPPREPTSDWLYHGVFPTVRQFLREHRGHAIVYWEIDDLPWDHIVHWKDVGYLPRPSPRRLVEDEGLTTWEEVLQRDQTSREDVWGSLWHNEESRDEFRAAFEHYLALHRGRRTDGDEQASS